MSATAQTTRQKTRHGLLRSGAVLTRSGPITYDRSEIGLPGDGPVTIERTLETLSHPETLASLRGAPITLDHPPGGVTPKNFKEVVVGAVAGEPRVVGDVIQGDVLIGDETALAELDSGVRELSIGYDFVLGSNRRTSGPLKSNHVALVKHGRAGSSVRVLDSLEDEMSRKEVMDAVSAALDGRMEGFKMDGADAGKMKQHMMDAFSDAMKPIMDGMKRMTDAADEAAAAKQAADAKAKAAKDRDELIQSVRAEERARFRILTDARPMLSDEDFESVKDSEPKAILCKALGDRVPDADKRSTDYLEGALAVAKATDAAPPAATRTLPPGVSVFDGQRLSASDARAKAEAEFIASQEKLYTDAGGV